MGLPITPPLSRSLWQAEGLGAIFEQGRVRPIAHPLEALSLVEEKVYQLLWGAGGEDEEFRLVHYSLQRISTDARINIKTVRELIPRLIDKGFIQIEHEADVRRNIPTLYRVLGFAGVLENQRSRNRFYIAKTGKGVFYVHPVSASFDPVPTPPPVFAGPMGFSVTPARPLPSPGISRPSGLSGLSSLDSYIERLIQQTKPATFAALDAEIEKALAAPAGEDTLRGILAACHQNAMEATGEPATDDELLYFTRTKAAVIAKAPNIRNHFAVLRKAVPDCFTGETFRAYRAASASRKRQEAEEAQEHERRRAELDRLAIEARARQERWSAISERHRGDRGYDMHAIAADADLDEAGRQEATAVMQRLGRYTPFGL